MPSTNSFMYYPASLGAGRSEATKPFVRRKFVGAGRGEGNFRSGDLRAKLVSFNPKLLFGHTYLEIFFIFTI